MDGACHGRAFWSTLDPTVSVVITNYNYGHFLPACLESIARQTVAVDQVLVVDDGSTDASRDYLAECPQIETLFQDNLGQAAAFNSGFSRATGAVVIFLDADDQLHPHATDIIKRLWKPHLALLSFDMTLVDGAANAIGRYPVSIPERDRLMQVRKRLLFPFMPTSGNAFSREKLHWAFPLPEPRWRISADTLLVRAAMLSGPSVHVRHTLGRYSAHGQNNFYSVGLSRRGRIRRALIDVADAGLDLLEMSRKPGAPIGAETCADIAGAALNVRLRADELMGDRPSLADFIGRLNKTARSARAHTVPRRAILKCVPLSRTLANWVLNPVERPRLLAPLLRGRDPRQGNWAKGACDVIVDRPHSLDLLAHLQGPGWEFGTHGASADLCQAVGQLRLRRLTGAASQLSISIGDCEAGAIVRVSLGDTILASRKVQPRDTIDLTLPPPDPINPEEEELRIDCMSAGLPRIRRRSLRMTVEDISIAPDAGTPPVLALPLRRSRESGWQGDGVEVLAGLRPDSTVELARPALLGPCLLEVTFGASQPAGRATLDVEGLPLFDGLVGPGKVIQVEVPFDEERNAVAIGFGFRCSAPLDEPFLDIAQLDWIPGALKSPAGPIVLTFGRRYAPPEASIFVDGWTQSEDDGTLLLGHAAEFRFALPTLRRGDAPKLRIDLERLDQPENGDTFALVATSGEEVLAKANLQGRAYFDVPLVTERHTVHLFLNASPIPPRPHSGLRLHGIELVGELGRTYPQAPVVPAPQSSIAALLGRLGASLPRSSPSGGPEAIRQEAIACVAGLSDSALKTISPDALALFAALGARLPSSAQATHPPKHRTAGNWLRWLSQSMLSGPGWRMMPEVSLTDFDAGQSGYARAIALYLADNPVLPTAESANSYVNWIAKRHREAQALLATAPQSSWHYLLAREFVCNSRPTGLYFQDVRCRDAVAAISGSIETLLLRDGHDLAGADIVAREPAAVSRLAILLRHGEAAPETWIVRSLLAALDRSRFDVSLFLLETSSPDAPLLEGEEVFALGHLPLGMAVAEIRRARPDIALIGSVFLGYGTLSTVCAHRLAPRQIALSSVSPLTTGFRSVDAFVIGDLVTPTTAKDDYVETLHRAPGTGQAFCFGPEAVDEPDCAEAWRARLGIGADAVVLVSGAMHDKIVPELLATWLRILVETPNAVLLLYPFARNWARNFDAFQFLERIDRACQATGMARDRVHVLSPIEHHTVRVCLSHADLYLDSFPYSGATTVVEALSTGLPVVAKAGSSQRCHQGAGWLTAFDLTDCVAETPDDYVRIATRIAGNGKVRKALRKKIGRNFHQAAAQTEFHEWFGRLLKDPCDLIEPRYVFHHMPKAGGTSLRRILSRWFKIVGDYREPWSKILPDAKDIGSLGPDQMLAGHFAADNMPLGRRYPEIADKVRWRKITFVRDPLDLALSIYFFDRARRGQFDDDFVPKPLGEYLRSSGGLYLKHFECNADTWREALDSYWFIGTLERMEDCVSCLAVDLGKPVPDNLPTLNVTERSEMPDPDDIEVFVRNNLVEFEMYREISTRLADRLGEPALDRL